MSAPDWAITQFDDWEVLWCNGEKIKEGHSLRMQDVFEEMEIDCEFIDAEEYETKDKFGENEIELDPYEIKERKRIDD